MLLAYKRGGVNREGNGDEAVVEEKGRMLELSCRGQYIAVGFGCLGNRAHKH